MQASGFLRSPNCSTASLGNDPRRRRGQRLQEPHEGLLEGELDRVAVGGLDASTCSRMPRLGLPLTVRNRSYVYLTSSAVSSRPFTGGFGCQRTPFRSLKIQVVSSARVHDSARSPSSGWVPGRTADPALTLTRRLWVKDRLRHGPEGQGELRIESQRVLAADAEDAAALGRLRLGRRRGKPGATGGREGRPRASGHHGVSAFGIRPCRPPVGPPRRPESRPSLVLSRQHGQGPRRPGCDSLTGRRPAAQASAGRDGWRIQTFGSS